tara:strand:- start:289 stop:594 length:306 start_codon:yes stop_codon:yes gene_type:complete
MPDFDVSKIILVLVFLGLLVSVQVILKRRKFFGVSVGKTISWPLKVSSTLPVSKFASATVIECAELSFLVVSGKNGSPAIIELPAREHISASADLHIGREN